LICLGGAGGDWFFDQHVLPGGQTTTSHRIMGSCLGTDDDCTYVRQSQDLVQIASCHHHARETPVNFFESVPLTIAYGNQASLRELAKSADVIHPPVTAPHDSNRQSHIGTHKILKTFQAQSAPCLESTAGIV